jgi:hypothetical protein
MAHTVPGNDIFAFVKRTVIQVDGGLLIGLQKIGFHFKVHIMAAKQQQTQKSDQFLFHGYRLRIAADLHRPDQK